jgi:hypothetical protein
MERVPCPRRCDAESTRIPGPYPLRLFLKVKCDGHRRAATGVSEFVFQPEQQAVADDVVGGVVV